MVGVKPERTMKIMQPQETQRLYWIIGAITLVLLACIGAFTFISGSVIGRFNLKPTPTPLPPPVVNIQAIKSQAELSTVKYSAVTEVYNETLPAGLLDDLLGNKEQMLMLVYGDVQAGFDLSEIAEEDIWSDGRRVRLLLPPPKILHSSIDFEKTHLVFYDNDLLLDSNNPNLQGEAFKQAQAALEQAALQEGVLEQANEYGQLYFENFLYSLGFSEVEVVVDAQIFKE